MRRRPRKRGWEKERRQKAVSSRQNRGKDQCENWEKKSEKHLQGLKRDYRGLLIRSKAEEGRANSIISDITSERSALKRTLKGFQKEVKTSKGKSKADLQTSIDRIKSVLGSTNPERSAIERTLKGFQKDIKIASGKSKSDLQGAIDRIKSVLSSGGRNVAAGASKVTQGAREAGRVAAQGA